MGVNAQRGLEGEQRAVAVVMGEQDFRHSAQGAKVAWLQFEHAVQVAQALIVAFLQAFFLAFFLSLFALALAIACNTVMRLLPMGVGGYRFLDSLFVRLSFTLVPVTARNSQFIDVTSEQGVLKHTIIYNDAGLLDQLIAMVKESATQPAKT